MDDALFTDLYELTMLQSYFDRGMLETAAFDLFVRRLPEKRNYLIACGLDDVLSHLGHLQFTAEDRDYLRSLGTFSGAFIESLREFRFAGDVWAVPEGTVVFPGEPILEIVASLPEAQLVETYVMNQVHFQTLAASKAARVVHAARGRAVVDFGTRRTHGTDAALKAARAFYIAGVEATSNVMAGKLYGIPVAGTMAHSYIQAFDDELEAFRQFTRIYPDTTLLVDTYDTIRGVENVVRLAREQGAAFRVRAIRLDSGDLDVLARASRGILDEAGLSSVRIFASSSLDEYEIDRLLRAGAPIDGFGVGTKMSVSEDAPYLDLAYKLVEYAGRPRMKRSTGKVNLPGRKQVFRVEENGVASRDIIGLHDESLPGRSLLEPVMRGGKRAETAGASLDACRSLARSSVDSLPLALRQLDSADRFPVEISPALTRISGRDVPPSQ